MAVDLRGTYYPGCTVYPKSDKHCNKLHLTIRSQIRDVYKRATTHHLPDKLDIHLKYAGFEERRGEFGRAAEILRELEQKHHPEMLNLMLRRYSSQQGCQMAKFDPFLSLDCARVEGEGKERDQILPSGNLVMKLTCGA